jgi:hypothetical protein
VSPAVVTLLLALAVTGVGIFAVAALGALRKSYLRTDA